MTNRDLANAIKPVCVARGSIYRLERDGRPVALALRLANGEWGLYDENEKRLSKVAFKTPKMAAEAAERRGWGNEAANLSGSQWRLLPRAGRVLDVAAVDVGARMDRHSGVRCHLSVL